MSRNVAPMPFRAVLFDIGDTLWHSRAAPPAEEFRKMAAERASLELRARGLSHPDARLAQRLARDGGGDAYGKAVQPRGA